MDSLSQSLESTLSSLISSKFVEQGNNSSEKWIQDNLKYGIPSKAFPVGGILNGVLLLDEQAETTYVLPKNAHTAKWLFQTSETLLGNSIKQQRDPTADCVVDNLAISVSTSTVHFTVNRISKKLSANNIRPLYFAAIVNEMNTVVGQNELFIRSILLCKAWIAYESRRVSCFDLTALFKHDVIVVLLGYIFSSQTSSACITQPLQALQSLLDLLGDDRLDLSECTFGMCSVTRACVSNDTYASAAKTPAMITLREQAAIKENSFIRTSFASICDKYSQRYHNKIVNGDGNNADSSVTNSPFTATQSLNSAQSGLTESESQDSQITPRVIRNGISLTVFDPVTRQNLFSLEGSNVSLSEIGAAFRRGHDDIIASLSKETASVASIFPFICAAAENASVRVNRSPNNTPSTFSLLDICEMITAAEIAHSNKLSNVTLVRLVCEILNRHGPLPVGEIEKVLISATGIPDMSKILSVVFGGLQYFLTQQTEHFIVDGNTDYNPFVYVVSAQNQQPQQVKQAVSPQTAQHQYQQPIDGYGAPADHRSHHSNSIGSADSSSFAHGPSPLVSANSVGSNGSGNRPFFTESPPLSTGTPGSNGQGQQYGRGPMGGSPGLQVLPPNNGHRKPYYTDIDNRAAAAAVTNNGVYLPSNNVPAAVQNLYGRGPGGLNMPIPMPPPHLNGRSQQMGAPLSIPPPERPKPYFENKRYIGKDTYAKNSRAAILAMQEKEAERQAMLLEQQNHREQQAQKWQEFQQAEKQQQQAMRQQQQQQQLYSQQSPSTSQQFHHQFPQQQHSQQQFNDGGQSVLYDPTMDRNSLLYHDSPPVNRLSDSLTSGLSLGGLLGSGGSGKANGGTQDFLWSGGPGGSDGDNGSLDSNDSLTSGLHTYKSDGNSSFLGGQSSVGAGNGMNGVDHSDMGWLNSYLT